MATKVINGTVRGPDGFVKVKATVVISLSQPCTLGGTDEVVTAKVLTATDNNGAYTVNLYSNSDLTPAGTFYSVNESALDGSFSNAFSVIVPAGAGPFVMAAIMVAAPAPSPPAALDAAVVHLATAETITGAKTFTTAPVVPAASFPESAVAGLVNDIAVSAADDANSVHKTGNETIAGQKTFSNRQILSADVVHSYRTATETELVSGLDASLAETVYVNLTISRIMGAPINGVAGHRMKVVFTQPAGGNCAVTLNAAVVAPAWTVNLGANVVTELPLELNGANSKWLFASNPAPALGYIYVPNGYALTDVGVQNAVNDLINNTRGGIVDLGNLAYAFNGSVTVGVNGAQGQPVRVIGKGIQGTRIAQAADVPAFLMRGYLTELEALDITTSQGSPTTAAVQVMDTLQSALPGRVKLRRVQAKGFFDGLLVNPAHGIDQLWIDECLFDSNLQDGIHIVPGGGTALIDIRRSHTSNNLRHGTNVFTSSIIGHLSISDLESAGNAFDLLRIEGSTTNTILSVLLENLDLEQVLTGGGSNAALHAINVWKMALLLGQYSARAANTAFAGIWLENCRDVELRSPWIRRSGDGMGNCTNELYVSGANTQHIVGSGLSYFGTALDFTIDGTVPAGQVINEDNVVVLGRALLPAAGQLVPGATSFSLRNNANNADNLIITDAGAVTTRQALAVSAGGGSFTGGIQLETPGGGLTTGVVNLPATGGLAIAGTKVLALRSANGSAAQYDFATPSLGTITLETPAFRIGANTLTITGSFATQRHNWFRQPTISAATALTVTDAATVAIEGAPIAAGAGPAAITRKYQLWLQGTDQMRIDTTTASTIGATGAASALPANPLGYLPIFVGTTAVKIPYYNP